MQILNCTKHDIIVYDMDGRVRATFITNNHWTEAHSSVSKVEVIDGLPIYRRTNGIPDVLPPRIKGMRFIVDEAVARACPDRDDFIFPLDEVRNDGRVMGYTSFGKV